MSLFLFFFAICSCLISSSLSLISLNTTVCNGTGAGADHDVVEQLISCLVARRGYCRAGEGKNRTYGFSQCGASAVSQDCSACLQQGGDQLLSECKEHGGGRVYTDKCVVFYQPRPFSNDGGGDPVKGPECGDGAGGVADQIGKLLDGVLENVTSKNESFAVGVDGAVYAMAQCWGSAGMACGACLGAARDALAGICAGAASGGVAFDGCLLRYQSEPFDFQRRDDQLPPPTNALSGNETKEETRPTRRSNEALFFFLGGLSLLLVCAILLMIYWKSKGMNKLGKMLYPNGSAGGHHQFSGNLRIISYFDYKVLKKATNNFDPANQIGSGGFGPVYQGKLDDGRKMAVKKLAVENSQQGESEFLAEVRMITSIQHKNLVRLLGCCSDGSQRLLVYEYMKNRSLDSIIYGGNSIFLNWQIRFQIILGIARGLQYLHEDSHMRIVHRDIKASNILLDEKFQPKIGDFGLARFFPEDQAYLSTKFAGTIGYTAPEYAIRGELSEKADIYSYGVLVLEIISSRKNTDLSLPSDMQYLPEYAWKLYEKLQLIELLDPMLVADGYEERAVFLAIHVALLCMQPHPALRPPMSDIVAFLTCKADNIPTPVKPAFLDRRRSKEDVSWEDSSDGFPTPAKINSPVVARPGNRHL